MAAQISSFLVFSNMLKVGKGCVCSRTNMVKMVVVIWWGAGTRCGFGSAGAEPPENPQFLQSLHDLVIFSGRERKREILLGGIQRCWFIGSAPIETVSKDSCKQLSTSTARLHFWHIRYFMWINRFWKDNTCDENFVHMVNSKISFVRSSLLYSDNVLLYISTHFFRFSLSPLMQLILQVSL